MTDATKPQAKYFPVMKQPMLPKGTFSGKTALITGGGTGLGKGMALMLGSLGASVAIMGRRQHVLEDAAKELESQTGRKVLACSADIRDPEAVKMAIDKVEKELGLPTVIVNNAAGNFVSPTERLSPNAFKTIIDIVLNGTANVTLDIGKRLIAAQKGASILAITTTYTYRGSGFVVPSAAAKAGVENMMRFKDMALEKLPVGRFGNVEELSNLACFLLSDYSSFMTGETVVFDGGEIGFGAGEFNGLVNVEKDQWDAMEKMIRETNARQKGKPKL
ncbi:2,4-dienoyl-CoA reductase, mitochondrial [Orchesella cincta]|uniref:2,4-dienoyl-CoA reductase, mitochondrial n=1 Tax=Orchesella cincta TaxID=48709 RepID=A0A1D2NCN4_ORCCI|nr:2,4-dienoyl-CoA reductase, mitochondrial [Orchesella cincta]